MVRILVVDDNRDFAENVAELLDLEGYEAVVANSGAVALDILKSNDLQGVICDYHMPGINGIDVLNEIRADAQMSALLFVMVSAGGNFTIHEDHITRFLTKPMPLEELLQILADYFSE